MPKLLRLQNFVLNPPPLWDRGGLRFEVLMACCAENAFLVLYEQRRAKFFFSPPLYFHSLIFS